MVMKKIEWMHQQDVVARHRYVPVRDMETRTGNETSASLQRFDGLQHAKQLAIRVRRGAAFAFDAGSRNQRAQSRPIERRVIGSEKLQRIGLREQAFAPLL